MNHKKYANEVLQKELRLLREIENGWRSTDSESGKKRLMVQIKSVEAALAALEGVEEACGIFISQAKSEASLSWQSMQHEGHNWEANMKEQDYVDNHWEDNLEDSARAYLVKAGKIEDQ